MADSQSAQQNGRRIQDWVPEASWARLRHLVGSLLIGLLGLGSGLLAIAAAQLMIHGARCLIRWAIGDISPHLGTAYTVGSWGALLVIFAFVVRDTVSALKEVLRQ